MKTLRKISGLIAIILITGSCMFAQTGQQQVSDQEIKQYALALLDVQNVSQQAQEKMVKAVETEGLDVQRFNEIHQSEQNGQKVDASKKEIEKYKSATTEVEKIQINAQQKMEKKIAENGLTVDRYLEINALIENDPILQQKLQEFIQQS